MTFFFSCSFPLFYETLCQNCVFLPGFQLNQYVCCHVGECDLFPETTQSVDLNLKIKGGGGLQSLYHWGTFKDE